MEFGSIPLSPETQAAIKARREKRMSMTAEDYARERRKERKSSMSDYTDGMLWGITIGAFIGSIITIMVFTFFA